MTEKEGIKQFLREMFHDTEGTESPECWKATEAQVQYYLRYMDDSISARKLFSKLHADVETILQKGIAGKSRVHLKFPCRVEHDQGICDCPKVRKVAKLIPVNEDQTSFDIHLMENETVGRDDPEPTNARDEQSPELNARFFLQKLQESL